MNSRSIKYKMMSVEELIINLDRLTRFKIPKYSFYRVFSSIISKYLISPKLSMEEICNLPAKDMSDIVKIIWNSSIEANFKCKNDNSAPNEALKLIINNAFKNIDNDTKILIKTGLHISPILEYKEYNEFNLKFLQEVNKTDKNLTFEYLCDLRREKNLTYPIEKLLIVEGITEEILLPVFANKLNKNFKQNGIFILGAGGKSKSPTLYMDIKDYIKIPVILLFDNDAKEICTSLKPYLSSKDKCMLIKNGEFEDILSLNHIKRTLNSEYEPASLLTIDELREYSRICDSIENFYRTRHLGEYKKSKVAKLLAQNLSYKTDITDDIKEILSFI